MVSNNFFSLNHPLRTSKEALLLRRLNQEYNADLLTYILLPFVKKTCPASLRLLDWAVVNWSKKHHIICSSLQPGRMTNVHTSYRKTLYFWKRKLFDPFRRGKRVFVVIDGEERETTLGQANFALWMHKTGILSYILLNIQSIEADMNEVSRSYRSKKKEQKSKEGGNKVKRGELTLPSESNILVYHSHCTVNFD